MKETLQLDDNDINDLKETFNCETKLIIKDEKVYYNSFLLIKRNLKIVMKGLIRDVISIQNLNNLAESLFQIMLCDEREPILLIGPTCYKTYISKLIFLDPILASLNEEYTLSQLLGNPSYFSKDEYRNYWISQISKLLDLPKYIIKEDLKDLKKIIVKKIHNSYFFQDSIWTKIIMERFKTIFPDEKKDEIKDILIDFKFGIILDTHLTEKDLILKNLGKVKTSVLERFNDFFSNNNKITLNEDIENNFTSEYNKELEFKNYRNRNNRIIATTRLGEEKNFRNNSFSFYYN